MNAHEVALKLMHSFVDHPSFQSTLSSLHSAAVFAQPGSVIVLVGPTNVGKTTMSRCLTERLVGRPEDGLEEAMPVIRIEAATTDQGFISTKYLIAQYLRALKHPFHDGNGYQVRIRDSETALRPQLEEALKYRNTRYLITDEAHHLLRTKSIRSRNGALDTLKCLVNDTGCVLVLIGGYELLTACLGSPHLNGRMRIIDFPNYSNQEKDAHDFNRLLASVDTFLSWRKDESLLIHRDLLYRGSLGCFGLMSRWVISALAEMTAIGDIELCKGHFHKTRLDAQLLPIRDEIDLGMRLIRELHVSSSDTIKKWKTEPELGQKSSASAKRRGRPFKRNPKRDPVG